MLQRLSEVAYNRYRAYLRRRRDPVREIYGDALPAALEPPRRALLRRLPATLATAALLGSAIGGGVSVWEDHQQEARVEAEIWEASAEFWALAEAYEVVREDEMRERGLTQEDIGQANAAAFAEFVSGEERGPDLPAPRDPATLQIRDQLDEAEARLDAAQARLADL